MQPLLSRDRLQPPLMSGGIPKSRILLDDQTMLAASSDFGCANSENSPCSHHTASHSAVQGTCPSCSPGARARHTLLLPSGVPTFVLPAWAVLGSWANRLCHAFNHRQGISALHLDSHHPMHWEINTQLQLPPPPLFRDLQDNFTVGTIPSPTRQLHLEPCTVPC